MKKQLALLAALCLMLGTVHAAAIYTFSNGAMQDVPVEPYFLDPGDNVQSFYSYGSPQGSSANTGFEQINTALVYLTLDDQGDYGLVVVLDKWGGGGGQAELSISGFLPGATRVVSDDSGEAGQVTAGGTAFCDWNWANCCTDGVAYSLGSGSDFTLALDFNFQSGIDTLRFYSFDPCSQEGGIIATDLNPGTTLYISSTEIAGEIPDCNGNNLPDFCDLFNGTSFDCNGNDIPDECENDCNGNGLADECDLASGFSLDCNQNGVPDECDLASGFSLDCNGNGVPDECDLASGFSQDCNSNGVPDECEADCNGNGIPDDCDLASGFSLDCNQNSVPDECDIASGFSQDCNGNGVPDECDGSPDCNLNGVPDECDIASGTSQDLDGNGVPDECEETVDAREQPAGFALLPVAPNPFNPSTVLRYSLPEAMEATLVIYDLQGRQVKVLASGLQERGAHSLRFEAAELAGGMYFAVLESESGRLSQKMLLLK